MMIEEVPCSVIEWPRQLCSIMKLIFLWEMNRESLSTVRELAQGTLLVQTANEKLFVLTKTKLRGSKEDAEKMLGRIM